MTRNTGRAQCARTADPCNKVPDGASGRPFLPVRRRERARAVASMLRWKMLPFRLLPLPLAGEADRHLINRPIQDAVDHFVYHP